MINRMTSPFMLLVHMASQCGRSGASSRPPGHDTGTRVEFPDLVHVTIGTHGSRQSVRASAPPTLHSPTAIRQLCFAQNPSWG